MSQYLTFTLKKKDNPEIKVDLGFLCTTPARTIPNETGTFGYTEEDTPVTLETLDSAISRFRDKVKEGESRIADRRKKIESLKSLIATCTSREVLDGLLERIEEEENSISDYIEYLDDWAYYKSLVEFIKGIVEDNSNNGYELYYSNC